MDINDIITLANAGYTKSDISALLGVQTPVQAPVQTPVQIPAQTQLQAPAHDDSINKMLAEMSLLRQDLQTSNIINSQQPKVETADDIIAKIINPPIITKEG